MLKRITSLTKSLFKKTHPRHEGPYVVSSDEHDISPKRISKAAREVVDVLSKAGFEAYVVGGCVRDLLLGLQPKDFDVATDATPEEVKRLFRRSRIIGRRFQIVHVRFGREIIEVTTFRGHHEGKSNARNTSKQGMLLRDNTFGEINEDAARRDFTVNALYYHPQDNTIYDYANGLPDFEQRILRILGDAEQRYREDPVRMLRAIRFSAKLGFDIEQETARPIAKLSRLLKEVPAARIFDEVLKLLMSGHALATFKLLREYQLFGQLFPATNDILDQDNEWAHQFIEQALVNTDLRIRSGKRVTPAFLLAALLWPCIVAQLQKNKFNNYDQLALQRAGTIAIEQLLPRIAIPRRFTTTMREIWDLQNRLFNRHGKRAERMVEHPRFRAAYDFILLREEAGEELDGLGHWWTVYQDADEKKRLHMASTLSGPKKPRKRRRRRPPAKASNE